MDARDMGSYERPCDSLGCTGLIALALCLIVLIGLGVILSFSFIDRLNKHRVSDTNTMSVITSKGKLR